MLDCYYMALGGFTHFDLVFSIFVYMAKKGNNLQTVSYVLLLTSNGLRYYCDILRANLVL